MHRVTSTLSPWISMTSPKRDESLPPHTPFLGFGTPQPGASPSLEWRKLGSTSPYLQTRFCTPAWSPLVPPTNWPEHREPGMASDSFAFEQELPQQLRRSTSGDSRIDPFRHSDLAASWTQVSSQPANVNVKMEPDIKVNTALLSPTTPDPPTPVAKKRRSPSAKPAKTPKQSKPRSTGQRKRRALKVKTEEVDENKAVSPPVKMPPVETGSPTMKKTRASTETAHATAKPVERHLRLPFGGTDPELDDGLPSSLTKPKNTLVFAARDAAGVKLEAETTFEFRVGEDTRIAKVDGGSFQVSLSEGMRLFESVSRHKLLRVFTVFRSKAKDVVGRIELCQSERDEHYKAFSMAFSERNFEVVLLVKFASMAHEAGRKRRRHGAYQRTYRVVADMSPGVTAEITCNDKPMQLFADPTGSE